MLDALNICNILYIFIHTQFFFLCSSSLSVCFGCDERTMMLKFTFKLFCVYESKIRECTSVHMSVCLSWKPNCRSWFWFSHSMSPIPLMLLLLLLLRFGRGKESYQVKGVRLWNSMVWFKSGYGEVKCHLIFFSLAGLSLFCAFLRMNGILLLNEIVRLVFKRQEVNKLDRLQIGWFSWVAIYRIFEWNLFKYRKLVGKNMYGFWEWRFWRSKNF